VCVCVFAAFIAYPINIKGKIQGVNTLTNSLCSSP